MNRMNNNLISQQRNKEIVDVFRQCKVEFIVIGGLAIAWYCDSRQADDMDLLINPTPENSKRICNAFNSLKLNLYNENSFSKLNLQIPLRIQGFYADILTPPTDELSYSAIVKDAIEGKLEGYNVLIPSIDVLIRLKEIALAAIDATRSKHVDDIDRLRKINRCT